MLNLFAIALFQLASFSNPTQANSSLQVPVIATISGDIAARGGSGGWGGDIAALGGSGGWGGDIAALGGSGGWGGDIAV